MNQDHPGRPAGPPPSSPPPGPPGTPTHPAAPPPPRRPPWQRRLPWIVTAVAVVVALVAVLLVVLPGGDEAAAGEIFLEPAAATGADPFATGLEGDAVAVSTTAPATSTTAAGTTPATPSISGSRPGLYGGTRNATTCDPGQQADFLAANPSCRQRLRRRAQRRSDVALERGDQGERRPDPRLPGGVDAGHPHRRHACRPTMATATGGRRPVRRCSRPGPLSSSTPTGCPA